MSCMFTLWLCCSGSMCSPLFCKAPRLASGAIRSPSIEISSMRRERTLWSAPLSLQSKAQMPQGENRSMVPHIRLPGLPGQSPSQVPIVAFEADAVLPGVLMSSGWLVKVADGIAASKPISQLSAQAFDGLAQMLDAVLQAEAQREKARLDVSLSSLNRDGAASAEDVHSFVASLSLPLEDAGFRLASARDLALSSALQVCLQAKLTLKCPALDIRPSAF